MTLILLSMGEVEEWLDLTQTAMDVIGFSCLVFMFLFLFLFSEFCFWFEFQT